MNMPSGNLPSMRALIAFERFSRLGNVTRAAEELNTSQAAVSRHIRRLEKDLGVLLVKPSGRGIALTAEGAEYSVEVAAALAMLRKAGEKLWIRKDELVVACTHEVSHLILMPHYSRLKKALGARNHIRILTCEYRALAAMIDAGADIVFRYMPDPADDRSRVVLEEEVIPAASPAFLERHAASLSKSPDKWKSVPRLHLTKENSGWATWDDWYGWQGHPVPRAPQYDFDNYIYALEAATRDEGVVLAWRGFADRYLNDGLLVPIGSNWMKTRSKLYAVMTRHGTSGKLKSRFVATLAGLTNRAPPPEQEGKALKRTAVSSGP